MKKEKQIVVEFVSEKICESLQRVLRARMLTHDYTAGKKSSKKIADISRSRKKIVNTSPTKRKVDFMKVAEGLGASAKIDFESIDRVGKKHIAFVPGLNFQTKDGKLFVKNKDGKVNSFFKMEDVKRVYYK